jgi:hypothetical protein
MNPIRKACLAQAATLWKEQPSLGMLETVNEVRVALRDDRSISAKDLPKAEAIKRWLSEAIEAGDMRGPSDTLRR